LNRPRIKLKNASNSCKTIIKRCICDSSKEYWESCSKTEYAWKRIMPRKWLRSKLPKFSPYSDICTQTGSHAINLSTIWTKLKGNKSCSCRILRKKRRLSLKAKKKKQTYWCVWYRTVKWATNKYWKLCFSSERTNFVLESLHCCLDYNN